MLLLSGCNNQGGKSNKVKIDTENAMSFTISADSAVAGKEVVAYVKTKNNPGFLTMAVKIEYDSNAMILTKVDNGIDFADYNFIPSKKMQSGCKMSWFITELQNASTDGELLKLYFHVYDETKAGEYLVTILPINDGGIVNENKELITVVEGKNMITVK